MDANKTEEVINFHHRNLCDLPSKNLIFIGEVALLVAPVISDPKSSRFWFVMRGVA